MLKVHLRRTLIWAALFCLAGWLLAKNTDPIYEARAEITAGSPVITADNSMPLEVRRVLLPGVVADLDSDTNILKSTRIFREALQRTATELGKDELNSANTFQELFPMYVLDIPPSLNQYAPDQTRVVAAKVRAHTPEVAATIANNIAFSFSDLRKNRAKQAVSRALQMVTAAAGDAKKKLTAIDEQLKDIKEAAGISNLEEGSQVLTQSIEALRQKRTSVLAELDGLRAKESRLASELRRIPKTVAGASNTTPDPIVQGVREQLIVAESELAALRLEYLESSTFVKKAKEKVETLRARLKTAEKNVRRIDAGGLTSPNPIYTTTEGDLVSARGNIANLENQIRQYDKEIAIYESRIAKFPDLERRLFELQRNRVVAEEEYQKNSKYMTDLKDAATQSVGSILQLADKEYAPIVAPDVRKYVILATIVGALLGLAFSFAAESFRLPVHTSWQLGDLTSLPVSAAVPSLAKPLARRHALAMREPNFKPIESMRYMAFSIMAQENRPHVILFSAVGEEVDSSLAAAEFSIAMAKTGTRTILVDCDLRAPRVSEMFQLTGRSGVGDILGRTILPGESTDLFVATPHENLMILPAGSSQNQGISDFLTSHLSAMVTDLREKSETVVINCPPVDVFADASRLAAYVDHTCMVVSAKTTGYRAIPVAQEILEKSGAKSVSLVLTNAAATEEPFGTRTVFRRA